MLWSMGMGIHGQVEASLDGSWNDFTDLLRDAASIDRPASDKLATWWVAPMILKNGATSRLVEDIDKLGSWFGLDIDRDNRDIEWITGKMSGHTWCAYSTTNSHPDAQRWRVATLLDRCYTVEEHTRMFRWFANRLDGSLDEPTKNANRVFFVPARWDGEETSFHAAYGRPVIVDSILAMVPPIQAPTPPAYKGHLKAAPPGTAMITTHMLEGARVAPEGRRLYRLMCSAAKRYRLNGWGLTDAELAAAALSASHSFAPGKPRPRIRDEAAHAIRWAETNFSPLTDIERMRDRLRWQDQRRAMRK